MDVQKNKGRINKSFRLSPVATAALAQLASEKGKTETAVIEDLLRNAVTAGAQSPYDRFFAEFEKHFHSWMTGTLLSSRQSERYGFLIIEMLNSMIQNLVRRDTEMYMPTRRLEIMKARQQHDQDAISELSKYPSEAYRGAEAATQDYFAYMKQVKDNAK